MVSKPKKILIVGGTGFIGYHIANACLKKKWKVTSISLNKTRKIKMEAQSILFDLEKRDILKEKAMNFTLSITYVVFFLVIIFAN